MPLPLIYHPDFVTPLPPEHRFPMPKFGLIYQTLIQNGVAGLDQFHLPHYPPQAWLELAHTRKFVEAYLTGTLDAKAMRRIGLPWSAALVKRTCTAIGGTVLTAELALQHGLACSTAGGTHHAHRDFGSGYCIFNDLAIAARVTQQRGLAHRVLIVDLDVHQGDGTAAIFQDDPTVFTFSLHCQANFPFRKKASDLDIGLPVGATDQAYLLVLQTALPDLLTDFKPDLVLYDGGVDPHVDDRLGKLALTNRGLLARDRFVLESCISRAIPVACVVGGGYAQDVALLAQRHAILHQAATELYDQYRL